MMTRRIAFVLTLVIGFTLQPSFGFSLSAAPQIAQDQELGYDRSLFKHWIDADKDGCDTRAEVLISEAVIKPKIDKKCKITGGKWFSAYDGKSVTNASLLDLDHLVPLAEAWRSGAWAWTPKQRQDYANDLGDKRALIAVTLTSNRSKSDQDISDWVPKLDSCGYVKNWIAIKIRYSLTYDSKEAKALLNFFEICKFGDIPVQALAGYNYQSDQPTATATPTPTPTPIQTIKKMPILPKPQLKWQETSAFEIEIPLIENWDFSMMTLKLNLVGIGTGDCTRETVVSSLPFTLRCSGTLPNQVWIIYLVGSGTYGKVQPTNGYSENLSIDSFPKSSTSTTISPKPAPTATSTKSASSPAPSPSTTPTAQPMPSQSQTPSSPAAVKYKNCTDAKAAGVAPITKSSNPSLYDLNSGLDRDKDGVACES